MKVLIRTDASIAIGSGHIARCLTLAQALRKHGAEVVFACRQLKGHLLQRVIEHGFVAHGLPASYPQESGADIEASLPWQSDIDALTDVLGDELRFDWLIVDHYGLDAQWETAARRFAERLMAIDDLANRPHAADLLLDQNFSAQAVEHAYAAWVGADCQTLLGPRFALMREAFECQPIEIRPKVTRVVVNFGGFDAARQVFATLLALQCFTELEVDFVAGLHNPDWDTMSALAAARPQWRLHTLVDDFCGLLLQADLFIGAGGGTTWERAALGLPTVCISVANNQRLNAQLLAQAGAHLYLGAYEQLDCQRLTEAVALLCGNRELRQSFAQRSRALVDGKGAMRVVAALMTPVLALRPATARDADLLFEGRNAEHVRCWSFNREPIDRGIHQRWLDQSLSSANRLLLIAETVQGPLGVLRYDRQEERVEVSIYLMAGQLGLGWGRALLQSGERYVREHWPDVRIIEAQAMADNAVSITLFQKAGYVQAECYFQRVINDE
ncbi:UDP-2,4-diacetamido-2,4,6-trideoxy-beta-L-altropyranose hydrolase [Pseudomonas huanghezhanensis]|uniref:UDP-2,4-diacetamido-2,4, 6-trideoxy-beta-L-altropyranose hydrolase n=1 Tax=Pseudomonas huanghezhanensis TaxID=3002903 RepID=UPI002285EF43|nr:UDP-2,4-diacetamido-2,4,6-trideoxy-beta-L-altropyranose hydrolase [Pseudomonas sp. BSw22131]